MRSRNRLTERILQAERAFNTWPEANRAVNTALIFIVVLMIAFVLL